MDYERLVEREDAIIGHNALSRLDFRFAIFFSLQCVLQANSIQALSSPKAQQLSLLKAIELHLGNFLGGNRSVNPSSERPIP
jgi:hypothetical protein